MKHHRHSTENIQIGILTKSFLPIPKPFHNNQASQAQFGSEIHTDSSLLSSDDEELQKKKPPLPNFYIKNSLSFRSSSLVELPTNISARKASGEKKAADKKEKCNLPLLAQKIRKPSDPSFQLNTSIIRDNSTDKFISEICQKMETELRKRNGKKKTLSRATIEGQLFKGRPRELIKKKLEENISQNPHSKSRTHRQSEDKICVSQEDENVNPKLTSRNSNASLLTDNNYEVNAPSSNILKRIKAEARKISLTRIETEAMINNRFVNITVLNKSYIPIMSKR